MSHQTNALKKFLSIYLYFFANVLVCVSVCLSSLLAGCANDTDRSKATASPPNLLQPAEQVTQVNKALQHYASLMLNMDYKGIAAVFAPSGEIVNPGQKSIQGREAIEQFLSGFSAYRILSYNVTPASTIVDGDTAIQTGSFKQRVRIPIGDIVEPSGSFKAEWVHNHVDQWQLQRMSTKPSP